MINYIGIDYINNKFKVDMKSRTVQYWENLKWHDIPYVDIETYTSQLASTNNLVFKLNGYVYEIEVSCLGLSVNITVRDSMTGQLYKLPEHHYNYSINSINELFDYVDNIPTLKGNIFYNITSTQIENLTQDRLIYLTKCCVNNIKSDGNASNFLNYYTDLLTKLVYKLDPEIELVFYNE